MPKEIEYVLYENEKNNEYINALKPINPAVKKIRRTETGAIMEEFYDFSKYRNVRTLSELSKALNEDEYLIIELNDEIRKTVDPKNIIPYVTHEPEVDIQAEKTATSTKEIGEKLHLVKYGEFNSKDLEYGLTQLIPVQIQMNQDGTCDWAIISYNGDSTRQLDEHLAYVYGGFSGVYYTGPKEIIEQSENYYEITKLEEDKWEFIKLSKGKNF